MLRKSLAFLAGIILVTVAYGNVEAADPTLPDNTACTTQVAPLNVTELSAIDAAKVVAAYQAAASGEAASGVAHYRWANSVCNQAEVMTADALNAVLVAMWREVQAKIQFSDLPCATFDADDRWVAFVSTQGVFIGGPATWNKWVTFGSIEVCKTADRVGLDPVTQLAKLGGTTFAAVFADVAAQVNAAVGPNGIMTLDFYKRFYSP